MRCRQKRSRSPYGAGEHGQLGHQLGVPAERQPGLDPDLQRVRPAVFQRGRGRGQRRRHRAAEQRSPPAVARRLQPGRRLGRPTGGQRGPPGGQVGLEAEQVEPGRRGDQPVAARGRLDPRAAGPGSRSTRRSSATCERTLAAADRGGRPSQSVSTIQSNLRPRHVGPQGQRTEQQPGKAALRCPGDRADAHLDVTEDLDLHIGARAGTGTGEHRPRVTNP